MKKIVLFVFIATFVSCKNETKEKEQSVDSSAVKISGQELFEGAGNCIACHKPDQKSIGPSLQEIAKIYKAKKENIVLFFSWITNIQYVFQLAPIAVTSFIPDRYKNITESGKMASKNSRTFRSYF